MRNTSRSALTCITWRPSSLARTLHLQALRKCTQFSFVSQHTAKKALHSRSRAAERQFCMSSTSTQSTWRLQEGSSPVGFLQCKLWRAPSLQTWPLSACASPATLDQSCLSLRLVPTHSLPASSDLSPPLSVTGRTKHDHKIHGAQVLQEGLPSKSPGRVLQLCCLLSKRPTQRTCRRSRHLKLLHTLPLKKG